jgi:hypothetical protein
LLFSQLSFLSLSSSLLASQQTSRLVQQLVQQQGLQQEPQLVLVQALDQQPLQRWGQFRQLHK